MTYKFLVEPLKKPIGSGARIIEYEVANFEVRNRKTGELVPYRADCGNMEFLLPYGRVAGWLFNKQSSSGEVLALTGLNYVGATLAGFNDQIRAPRRVKVSSLDAVFKAFKCNQVVTGNAPFSSLLMPVLPIKGNQIRKGDMFIVGSLNDRQYLSYVSLVATKDFVYSSAYHPNFNKSCWEEWRSVTSHDSIPHRRIDVLLKAISPTSVAGTPHEGDIFSIAMSNCALGNLRGFKEDDMKVACQNIQYALETIGTYDCFSEKAIGPNINLGFPPSRYRLGEYLSARQRTMEASNVVDPGEFEAGSVVRVRVSMFDLRASHSIRHRSVLVLRKGPLTKFNCIPLAPLNPFLKAEGLGTISAVNQYLCFDGIEEISPCAKFMFDHSVSSGAYFEKISNRATFMGNESYRGQISPKMILRSGYALAESVTNISMYDMQLFKYIPTSREALQVIGEFITKNNVGLRTELFNSAMQATIDVANAVEAQSAITAADVINHAERLGARMVKDPTYSARITVTIPVHCGAFYESKAASLGTAVQLRKILFYQHSEADEIGLTHESNVVMVKFGMRINPDAINKPNKDLTPLDYYIESALLGLNANGVTDEARLAFDPSRSDSHGARGIVRNTSLYLADLSGVTLEYGLTNENAMERLVNGLMPNHITMRDSLFQVDLPTKDFVVGPSEDISTIIVKNDGRYPGSVSARNISDLCKFMRQHFKALASDGTHSYVALPKSGTVGENLDLLMAPSNQVKQGVIRPFHVWSKCKNSTFIRRDIYAFSLMSRNLYHRTGLLKPARLTLIIPTYNERGLIDLTHLAPEMTAVESIVSKLTNSVKQIHKSMRQNVA